jgi:hypothetical protein
MQWSNLTYNGDLQDYIDKTRASLLDIETVNITNPKELVSYLILGKLLNRDLDQVVDKITLLPDCTEDPYLVLNVLQTYHTHKLNKSASDPATAMVAAASSNKFPFKIVHYCGGGEHNPKVTSHPESRYFEKYPHLGKAAKASKAANASASLTHASVFATFTLKEQKKSFVIDSAASHHMLSNKSLFSLITPTCIEIKTGSLDSKLRAEGIGNASVVIGGRVITLYDTLYVPCISQQLVSLVRLIKSSITISIDGDNFDINDPASQLLSGFVVDNLLHVPYSLPSAHINKATVSHVVWHQRLGHPGENVMRLMGILSAPPEGLCEVCNCSKMTLQPFPDHFSQVQRPLQHIHMDLVGPINPSSVSGFKYIFSPLLTNIIHSNLFGS